MLLVACTGSLALPDIPDHVWNVGVNQRVDGVRLRATSDHLHLRLGVASSVAAHPVELHHSPQHVVRIYLRLDIPDTATVGPRRQTPWFDDSRDRPQGGPKAARTEVVGLRVAWHPAAPPAAHNAHHAILYPLAHAALRSRSSIRSRNSGSLATR